MKDGDSVILKVPQAITGRGLREEGALYDPVSDKAFVESLRKYLDPEVAGAK